MSVNALFGMSAPLTRRTTVTPSTIADWMGKARAAAAANSGPAAAAQSTAARLSATFASSPIARAVASGIAAAKKVQRSY